MYYSTKVGEKLLYFHSIFSFLVEEALTDNRKDSIRPVDKGLDIALEHLGLDFYFVLNYFLT